MSTETITIKNNPNPPKPASSRTTYVLLGIGSAIIFATSVTNSIVYASGTTSSNGSSSNNCGSGGGEIGINSNCALIMLVLNIIIAIITFFLMIWAFYMAAVAPKQQAMYEAYWKNYYNAQAAKFNNYEILTVGATGY